MRKLLSAFLCLLMLSASFSSVCAKEKSIEKLSSGQQVENASKSYEIIYKEKTARVFYGNNGIDIVCEDETVHFNTSSAVLKLLPVGDVNNDGFIDFAVTQNSLDSADNFYIIDGKEGKVLSSTCLTRETAINGEYAIANTYVLMMAQNGNDVIVVYDYTIMSYNCVTGEKNFEYVNDDNVWDIEIVEGQIAFIDQLGRIGFVDLETGALVTCNRISNAYECELSWDEGTKFTRDMNLWDLYYENGSIYVTSEDGRLYTVDLEGNVVNDVFLNAFTQEEIEKSIAESYRWNGNRYVGKSIGITDTNFKSFKIVDSNEQYLLIAYNFIDEECLEKTGYLPQQGLVLYDKQTQETTFQKLSIQDSNITAICFTTYQGQKAIALVKPESSESMKVEYRDYEGTTLYQKSVDIISNSSQAFVTVENKENGLFIESYNAASVLLNEKMEGKYCFDTVAVEMIYLGDSITFLYSVNGRKNKIVNLQLDCETVNWEYSIADSTTNKGIDKVIVDCYNSDEVADYICLIQNYNSKDENVDTTFLIINGKDGSKIDQRRVFQYESYDEKGKKYNVYLTASDCQLIKDIDGDKKKELLINGMVVTSNGLKCKGSINSYIDAKGEQVEIGDVNGDKIPDFIMLTETAAVLYQSKRSSYDYSYVKAGKSATLKKADKSNQFYTVIGDINNDGAKEIAFSTTNSEGYQTYTIYNGKTLAKMYTICPRGVGYNEIVSVTDFDFDGDGYNEIIHYSDSVGSYGILNGKTGEAYTYINLWEEENISPEAANNFDIWHPEDKVSLFVEDINIGIVKYKDINGDGIVDYALIKNYTDYETWEGKRSIFIYSGSDFSLLNKVDITGDEYYTSVVKVENSEDYLFLIGNQSISLINASSEETIATYSIICKKFTLINDSSILAMDEEKKLYILNIENAFELLTKIDEETDQYKHHFQWKNNSDYSVMTITDNNEIVYRGSAEEVDIRFTEGNHKLVFSMNDGQGKSSIRTITFTVSPQENKNKYIAAVAAVVAIAAIVINVSRKFYISRKVKGGLK